MSQNADSAPWTFRVARPHRRVWLQSTERFATAEEASLSLCMYLALIPEESGSFVGEVVPANEDEPSFVGASNGFNGALSTDSDIN